jgi:hypothetical protein
MAITHQQAKQLLQSPELAAVEEAIAARTGQRVLRGMNPVVEIQRVEIDVGFTPLSFEQITASLKSDRELLISFWTAVLGVKESPEEADGEFPPGEELDPADRSRTIEVIGLGSGFGIKAAVYLYLLRDCPKAELTNYLKKARIPFAAKYGRELRDVFARVGGGPGAG